MNETLFIGAIIILVIGIITLAILVLLLNKRITALTKGAKGNSLEEIIHELKKNHLEQEEKHEQLVKNTKSIHKRVTDSVRGFAIHKFNAYEHTGGNQSFCCAILDENGRGMLLSNLYSRERSNVFAKPVHNFTCEFDLTKEEKTVLEQAIASMR